MYKVRFNLGRGKSYMKWKVDNLEDKTNQCGFFNIQNTNF